MPASLPHEVLGTSWGPLETGPRSRGLVLATENLDGIARRDTRHNPRMTRGELERLAEELGIDVIGAAPAGAYDATERHIRERRERGLFADMRFTMAQPETSCH